MEAINSIELTRANYLSIPLSRIGEILCKTNGQKNFKEEWVNPYPSLIEKKRLDIHPKVANLFCKLSSQGKVPSWVFSHVDKKSILSLRG